MKQLVTQSMQLGRILAARRKAAKLTQRDVAEKLGISQSRLSEIETNPSGVTLDRLLDLAGLLELDLVVEDRATGHRSSRTEW